MSNRNANIADADWEIHGANQPLSDAAIDSWADVLIDLMDADSAPKVRADDVVEVVLDPTREPNR